MIATIGAKALDEFVQAVAKKRLRAKLPGFDPAVELNQRLRYLFAMAAEKGLDLDSLRTLDEQVASTSGEDLNTELLKHAAVVGDVRDLVMTAVLKRFETAIDQKVEEAGRLRMLASQLEKVNNAGGGALTATNVAWLTAQDNGLELWRNVVEVTTHPLMVSPENVLAMLTELVGKPDEYSARSKGALDETGQALELLRARHIIQMGKLNIGVALERIAALKLSESHPSAGAQRYAVANKDRLSGQGAVAGDIIDWTNNRSLQLKASSGSFATVVGHIVKALQQLQGHYGERAVQGPRFQRQARITLDDTTHDPVKLVNADSVKEMAARLAGTDVSIAIITDTGTDYFVPAKNGTWVGKKSDPALA